jgi:hypothetical protein
MAGGLKICTVAGPTLIMAPPTAMFLLARNWSNVSGLVVEVEAAIGRAGDQPYQIPHQRLLQRRGDL